MDQSTLRNADYVIVGAGSAGCVLAARLSEDPRTRVVLVEAGGRDRNPWLHIPVGFSRTIGDPRFDWNHFTGPEPGLDDRMIHYARGRTLGGSSAINGLAWVTGGRRDYDRWRDRGCDQWGYDQFAPWLRRIENFPPGGAHRGKDGPIRVQYNPGWANSMDRLVAAFEACGIARVEDYNTERPFGVGRLQTNVGGGRRMSAATAYLVPARGRANLAVVTDAEVEAVTIENGAATGVRLRRAGGVLELAAAREVIVCGGALGSPALLEASGIGDPARLRALGVAVRGAAPEVGENLKDHCMVHFRMLVRGLESINGSDRGLRAALTGLRYLLARSGPMVTTPTQLNGFVRAMAGDGEPDIQVMAMALSYHFRQVNGSVRAVMDSRPGMSVSFYPVHPRSAGSVHLDADRKIRTVCNFLTDPADRQVMVAGMRLIRKVLRASPIAGHVVTETTPGAGVGDSDEELLGYARATAISAMHPTGTCRMGADERSVVDQGLRVRACRRLRVADASVMPDLPGNNTNAPTIALAERAAAMIRAETR